MHEREGLWALLGLAQSPPQSARAFKISGNETSRASLVLAKRNVASGNEIGAGQTYTNIGKSQPEAT